MLTNARSKTAELIRTNRVWVASWLIIVPVVLLGVRFWPQGPSPVPERIRQQADFTIIYPSGYSYLNDWTYSTSDASVQFSVQKDGYKVVFTEEKVPLAYQNDQSAYDRFIGSLRPRANFNVLLGTVSITNFVTAGDYQIVGDTGVLKANDTLLLAHPDAALTDDQWRALFESLKLD